ncbi:MAG: AMP-binding protein [Chloroflexota bacterium]
MPSQSPPLISFASRIQQWAAAHPEKTALIFVPESGTHQHFSWQWLDTYTNQLAHFFAQKGIDDESHIVIGLINCPEHIFVAVAAWKLGAMVVPIRNATPPHERDQILALADPKLVVTDWVDIPYPTLTPEDLNQVNNFPTDPLPDIIAFPGKAMTSGGSTGRPKLIVDTEPWGREEGWPVFDALKLMPSMVQLVAGALYHTAPFSWAHMGLYQDQTLILTAHFDPIQVVELIEQYQVEYAYMAPIMMSRIAKLPEVKRYDLSSMTCLIHTAAPCPPWLKRTWFDLIGAEHVLELYAATEAGVATVIWGDEWLAHPNSVGRAAATHELRILDAEGEISPTGEVGEIFMRRLDQETTEFSYVGSPPAKMVDGFASVGDLGWLDEDGYLYIADRRVDMIITGGANVFPAEVEAVLTEHPAIGDVAVIGLRDEEWGKRVHAVIQPRDEFNLPSLSELDTHCRARLMAYKVPKTYDFVAQLPRSSAGKIRRSALIAEREPPS